MYVHSSTVNFWNSEAGPLFINMYTFMHLSWILFVPTTNNNRQLPKNRKYISRTFSNKNIHYFSLFKWFVVFSSHSDTVCHSNRHSNWVATWIQDTQCKKWFFFYRNEEKEWATWQKLNAHNLSFSFAIIVLNCIRQMLTSLPFHINFKLKKILMAIAISMFYPKNTILYTIIISVVFFNSCLAMSRIKLFVTFP